MASSVKIAQVMTCMCSDIYQDERDGLSSKEIDAILETGRAWDLSSTLSCGGVALFPHTYLSVCASYIAACVHGALDSGADHVLALGVLHSFTDEFLAARAKERARHDLSDFALRGVHGPKMQRGEYWKSEYSLLSFVFLWNEEIKRRGIKPPKLSLRFPYLVNRQPQTLPGISELEAIAKDACLVATGDFCHHGVAYGTDKEHALTGKKALEYAKSSINDNLNVLMTGDYAQYYEHCLQVRSDSFDVGSIIYHLRGLLEPTVHDVGICDTSLLYEGTPSPSWVAPALIELKK